MGTESVAQETYQRGAQTIDKIMQPLLEGIKKLIENARELREDRMAKMVLNWLNKEGEICFNICDDSIANEMKVRLKAENIPYIPYSIADKAKSGVLFRDCDQERVEGLRREILIERGGFLQEVPKSELFCASLNEKIVSLKDLSEEELEVMHNKAWSKGSGFTIATEKQENGKYTLYTRSADVYKNSGHSLADACNSAAFSLYGINEKQKRMELQYDNILKKKMFEYSAQKQSETMYIASTSDKSKYIELNPNGFEFHKYNEHTHSVPIAADRETLYYDKSLRQAFSAMKDCVMLSAEQFSRFKQGDPVVEAMRPQRSLNDKEILVYGQKFEKAFREKIKSNLDSGNQFLNKKEAFEKYCVEFKKLSETVNDKNFTIENLSEYGEEYQKLAEAKFQMDNNIGFMERVSEKFSEMTGDFQEKTITTKDYALNDIDRTMMNQEEQYFEEKESESEEEINID